MREATNLNRPDAIVLQTNYMQKQGLRLSSC
jgi:hypothetical protein